MLHAALLIILAIGIAAVIIGWVLHLEDKFNTPKFKWCRLEPLEPSIDPALKNDPVLIRRNTPEKTPWVPLGSPSAPTVLDVDIDVWYNHEAFKSRRYQSQ